MKHLLIVSILISIFSCKTGEEVPKEWQWQKTLELDGVNPIGIVNANSNLWLSDGDHNRLVRIDSIGKIQETVDSLERPMHIAFHDNIIYIPEYGIDDVSLVYTDGNKTTQVGHGGNRLTIGSDSLDAPAGFSIVEKEMAIADFYNNRILYQNGTDAEWMSFGTEGKAEGELYYPTDVQIMEDGIWVADAYNHRVQVFDKQGGFIKMIGQDQKMNAATGIYVKDDDVFVTDFENDRVLVFDRQGSLKQKITANIHKPTDMLVYNGNLYVLNYQKGELVLFEWKESPKLE